MATTTDIDIAKLGEKTRVHALAKLMNISSKALIAQLDAIGLVKVAQSTLTKEEVEQLFNTNKKQEEPKKDPQIADAKKEDDEKLRERIRKNVINEINQIEQKVEKELESTLPLALEPVRTQTPVQPNPIIDTIFLAPEPIEDDLETESPEDTYTEEERTEERKTENQQYKRRGSRGKSRGRGGAQDNRAETHHAEPSIEEDPAQQSKSGAPVITQPRAIRGSARLEAQRRRRTVLRRQARTQRNIVSEAEFLARRESVDRVMIVREKERDDKLGSVTQVGVLEDGMLVEHFVTSETQNSTVGNIYLGRVQNVLPSMEAAFIDIGTGRNGVLYAGEVDWHAAGLGGRKRTIEQALRAGDQVLVQVTKDPVGQKGARLTTQISLAGRYLVYVPNARNTGISRKLPEPERRRLKEIVRDLVPTKGGAIIRTAAEGVHESEIATDIDRLHSIWESIEQRTKEARSRKGAKPLSLYEEPNMLVKIVRDMFNEDFSSLVVAGDRPWHIVHDYVERMAPDLLDRVHKYDSHANGGIDIFEKYRIDEQIHKALSRKVWLPSGGSLVFDRTEAMTVIDVNTGKFTGSGGNLEETVTKNNLEAAEEIVRQMRLRDLGGIIVVDFIDMVLPENRDLVLRRLKEHLGRDRTRHQVSEVTSLGLVQMTRKKMGMGLLDTFATECENCHGRGLLIHNDPVDHEENGTVGVVRTHQRHNSEQDEYKTEYKTKADYKKRSRKEEKPAKPAPSQTMSPDEIVDIALEAVENAQRHDSDEDYAKALYQWENNPRRQRATRGNSRSDHKPVKAPKKREEVVTESSSSDNQVKKAASKGKRRLGRSSKQEVRSEGAVRIIRGTKKQAPEPEHNVEQENVQPVKVQTMKRRAVRRSMARDKKVETKSAVKRSSYASVQEPSEVKNKTTRSIRSRRRAVRKSK